MSEPTGRSGMVVPPAEPSLEGAYLRVNRAEEHIEALKRLQQELGEKTGRPRVLPDTETREHLPDGGWQVTFPIMELPQLPAPDPSWSVLVGETVYNLRSALDYLVYALAHRDSGSHQEQTQFPICGKQEEFAGQARRRLAGVNDTHVQAIEALQPYAGEGPDCDWLERLADLSNPDKHRHLVATNAANELHTEIEARKEPDGLLITAGVLPSVVIAFDDAERTAAVGTLQLLAERVKRTLDQFAPDFGVSKE